LDAKTRRARMKPFWRDWNNAIGRATFSAQQAGRVR
jgi:hypothetical protein